MARRVPDAEEEVADAERGEKTVVVGEKVVGVYEESDGWREEIGVENETKLHEDETGAAAETFEQREKASPGEKAYVSGEKGEFAGAGEEERSGQGFRRRMRYYVICFLTSSFFCKERKKEKGDE